LPILVLAAAAAANCSPAADRPGAPARPPNIVLLYADDLGYAEVGAYGQARIRTPNIDRLAAEGIRFTAHYSGSAVCAPSRAVLLTGKHTGHAAIRDNKEMGGWGPDEPEGQWPLPAEERTLAEMLGEHGYATGAMGKWGLGGPGSEGAPNRQGFDRFYGYLCQRVAHNYYPTHLWSDDQRDLLPGNEYFDSHQRIEEPPSEPSGWERYRGSTYAPDRIAEAALEFIRDHADDPFFLYFPTIVPHVSLQVPEDSLVEYDGAFDDGPYLGDRGYLPHPQPRAAYAAMVTRMDRRVGQIVDLIEELGLGENTLILFSSDNGPTFNGGTDSEFFDSAGPFRGLKTELYEGGIRVPLIARWPGRIDAGGVSDHVSAQWDLLPTILEAAGLPVPDGLDGVSLMPTLVGSVTQPEHDLLYWELGRQQAVREGDWKLVRRGDRDGVIRTELYDLSADIAESRDLSAERPEVVERLLARAAAARTPSEVFPSPFDAAEGG
jgi:arylsulfatase